MENLHNISNMLDEIEMNENKYLELQNNLKIIYEKMKTLEINNQQQQQLQQHTNTQTQQITQQLQQYTNTLNTQQQQQQNEPCNYCFTTEKLTMKTLIYPHWNNCCFDCLHSNFNVIRIQTKHLPITLNIDSNLDTYCVYVRKKQCITIDSVLNSKLFNIKYIPFQTIVRTNSSKETFLETMKCYGWVNQHTIQNCGSNCSGCKEFNGKWNKETKLKYYYFFINLQKTEQQLHINL